MLGKGTTGLNELNRLSNVISTPIVAAPHNSHEIWHPLIMLMVNFITLSAMNYSYHDKLEIKRHLNSKALNFPGSRPTYLALSLNANWVMTPYLRHMKSQNNFSKSWKQQSWWHLKYSACINFFVHRKVFFFSWDQYNFTRNSGNSAFYKSNDLKCSNHLSKFSSDTSYHEFNLLPVWVTQQDNINSLWPGDVIW